MRVSSIPKLEIHDMRILLMRYRCLITLFAGASVVSAQPVATRSDKPKSATFTVEQAITLRPISDLQFSPDGRRLAFTVGRLPKDSPREQEIWMLNVQSRKTWRFAHGSKSSRNPSWSPDGSQLAFLSDREERSQIWVMPTDGGEAERLTSGKNAIVAFAWSPKGDAIAFLAPEPKTEADEKKEKDKDDAREKLTETINRSDSGSSSSKARRCAGCLTDPVREFRSSSGRRKGDRLFVVAAQHPEPLVWRNRVLSVALADGASNEIAAPVGPIADLQVSPDGKSL